ncbi:MAG TPA: glycosyltransferase, partial [Thermoanaerobaculia bacterium]|nr:glycosyltransferase [Thermoanaerobaculia bacterium]
MAGSLPAPGGDFTVTALVATYNEEDVIGQVVADLIRQGVQVYLIDDGSTDGTVAQVEPWVGSGVVGIERRPAAETTSWAAILRRKEELAREL